ncbi:spermatogenesis-associated protein 5-like protein 1 isoform X2 [Cimex lectularius]|uniref:AAA+ ATPase domain-containing protein n=1 Tax=Cimex lectularius TaxID=79782 RepID=A0A8I6RMT6_CIMLE|nr:spermatogenesis-associated protein 5-like protein 1 isoform X2 [Cimex lectularius]
MGLDLRVTFESQTLEGLQRLYLPMSCEDELFGKYASVKLSDGSVYFSRIFPAYFLNDNSCIMDKTVLVKGVTTDNQPKVSQLTLIPGVRYIKSLKISVVLKVGMRKRSSSRSFKDQLKRALACLALVSDSIVSLDGLEPFSVLGVSHVLVHNIGKVDAGKVVHSTNLVIEKFISSERYTQLLPENNLYFKVFGSPYNKLKDYLTCRQNISKTSFAQKYNLPQVIIIGPAGSGKKYIVKKVAYDCKAVLITINCSELVQPSVGESESLLSDYFNKAIYHSDEGLVIILILHPESICRKPGRLLSHFIALIDSISLISNITAVLSISSTSNLHECVKTSSRFHFKIFVEIPNEEERNEMLIALCEDEGLNSSCCSEIAAMTAGYTISDLALLVHNARRDMETERYIHLDGVLFKHFFQYVFINNIRQIEPSMQHGAIGVFRKNNIEEHHLGGLNNVKKSLFKIIKWPILHSSAFKRFNLKTASGCLLYGPPGCAKTSIVRAVAMESNMVVFSVSAADLYSPYVGDAERTITDLFQRARASSPSILFIDEIDALVGCRGGRQNNAHERILSMFLIEMDGIGRSNKLSSALTSKVIVIAATNRPQVLDSALLRPGRFDKLIYVPPPNFEDRKDILNVLTKCH